jgi:PAS domain S-box-containing protein
MTTRSNAKLVARDFGGFLDAAPDAMVMVSREGRILAANARTLTLFGHTAEELIQQPIEVLVPERFRAQHVVHRTHTSPIPTRDRWARDSICTGCDATVANFQSRSA